MPDYAANKADIGDLRDVLGGQVNLLDQYKASAEAATTQSEFDKYKNLYSGTFSNYETQRVLLDELTQTYANVATARQVATSIVDMPNFKDTNQWMPGGDLKNRRSNGGSAWGLKSPVTLGVTRPTEADPTVAFFAGGVMGMLNTGFVSVQSKAAGGLLLDLITDFDVRSTVVISYKVVVSMSDGTSHTLKDGTYESGEGGGGKGHTMTSSGPLNLSELKDAFDARTDLRTALSRPIGLAIKVASSLYSGTFDLSNAKSMVQGAVIGTVQNMFQEQLISAGIKALGITNVGFAIGFSVIASAVLGELLEIGLGLDNNFGFGGEFVGYDANGTAVYGGAIGWAQGVADMFSTGVSQATLAQGEAAVGIELGYMDMYGLATYDIEMDVDAIGRGGWGVDGTDTSWGGLYADAVQNARNAYADTVAGLMGYSSAKEMKEVEQRFADYWADKKADKQAAIDEERGYGIGGDTPDAGGGGQGGEGSGGIGGAEGSDEQGSWSCFVKGTKVTRVIDGQHVEVKSETIVLGDVLLGQDGAKNEVLAYDCPLLGNRLVYSINNLKRFVTAEHPLMTTDGWKSIRPEALKEENAELYEESVMEGKVLEVGDKLVTVDGEIEVESIKPHKRPANSQLYNFRLNGNKTYYANGYLVHNK